MVAQDPPAFLKGDARQAEKSGDVVRAYLLYSQAAALNPKDRSAWGKAMSLRTQAITAAKLQPGGAAPVEMLEALPPPDAADLAEARRLQPPLRLHGDPGPRSFDLKGDSKAIATEVLKSYGIEAIFDVDFQPVSNLRLRLENVEFREAAVALSAATATFLVPVSERMVMVAKDTAPKRQELEHTMAVTIPLPSTISVQDVQELARSVQQIMEITKFNVDSTRRIALIRDRESKVIPAVALFEQLIRYRAEVMLEVEFLEANENFELDYGLQLPTRFPVISPLRTALNFTPFGAAMFGLGIANSQVFGAYSRNSTRTRTRAELRSSEGVPAQFHLGDKYPVMTGGYFGAVAQPGQQSYTPPPTFNFEDLGVVFKITPRVHGAEEITLEVEAEFKVLTGQALNGIPVIATRKFTSAARLKTGEAAVVAGLAKGSESHSVTGLALFRHDNRSKEIGQAIFVIRPRLLALPASEIPTRTLHTGTDTKPKIPF